jgi:hypothetical protein
MPERALRGKAIRRRIRANQRESLTSPETGLICSSGIAVGGA